MIFFNFLFMLCILPICLGFFTVEPLQAVVIMFMGKVVKVLKKPGLNWYFPIGRNNRVVSLGIF
jgi:regulator of protease activity HflC (stomatin/prohibitin superfamily)